MLCGGSFKRQEVGGRGVSIIAHRPLWVKGDFLAGAGINPTFLVFRFPLNYFFRKQFPVFVRGACLKNN